MVQSLKAGLAMAMLLCGIVFSLQAAADEHDRHAEPRHAAPPPPRPAPAARPTPSVRPAYAGHGQVLDSRYNHGRYYPPLGTVRPALPEGYRPYYHGGARYYFSGGIWYAPRGPGFVVTTPPVGMVISVLPPYYATVWFGGAPYYYANNVYYAWQSAQNGYTVVDAPSDADAPAPAPSDVVQSDLMIYPKNGQSPDEQAADQYECHNWAKSQSNFDPTLPDGGLTGNVDLARNNYNRAMSACLQGRGYQVN
jgi:hypothetical protein